MGESNPTDPVLSIGVVQKLTGLSGRQIRYYESTGLIHPHRTKGNQRLYSWADVERLRQIKELMNQGYNVEGVRTHLAQRDKSARVTGRDLIKQRIAGLKLSSLFPVNDQAELFRFLQERQKHQPE